MRLEKKNNIRMMGSTDLIKVYDRVRASIKRTTSPLDKGRKKVMNRIIRELERRGMSTRLIKAY